MQVQPLFRVKDSQKSQTFFSYKGSSKDTVIGSKLETKKYQDPQEFPMGEWNPSEQEEYPMGEWSPSEQEEYPMGEWSPSGESSCIAESVLAALGKSSIVDPNSSPTSADLCTTCFPMSEW